MVAVRQPRLAGAPRRAARPDALHAQDWLGFSREGTGLRLELQGPAGTARGLVVQPRIASNNQLSIQQMCEAGLGLALMGSMDVQDALQAGRLVRLLPQWSFGTLDIWAVTRSATPSPPRCARPSRPCRAICGPCLAYRLEPSKIY
jgi:DNA-binding transcriptional LysR family regulator